MGVQTKNTVKWCYSHVGKCQDKQTSAETKIRRQYGMEVECQKRLVNNLFKKYLDKKQGASIFVPSD